MTNLIIIGARGWGREVCHIAEVCISAGADFVIKGFLDDRTTALDGYKGYPPILSSVEAYLPQANDVFTCALGDPHLKKHFADIIKSKGGKFISLIHPSAHIGNNAQIGEGCIFSIYTNVGQDVTIGDFVTFDGYASVGHDCHIGGYTHIGSQSSIGGFSTIEENVTIHPGARIVPHTRVGENVVIGVGSIVLKKIKPNCVVFGNPAKVIDQINNF